MKNSVVIDRFQIELNSEREEQGMALTVCQKSKCFAVHLCGANCRASRLIVFELKNFLLEKRSVIDIGEENIKRFWAMEFFKYIGNHLILTAISCDEKKPIILTFCYNRKTKSFKELKDLRKKILAKWPFKLIRFDDVIFSSDNFSKIIEIKYSI